MPNYWTYNAHNITNSPESIGVGCDVPSMTYIFLFQLFSIPRNTQECMIVNNTISVFNNSNNVLISFQSYDHDICNFLCSFTIKQILLFTHSILFIFCSPFLYSLVRATDKAKDHLIIKTVWHFCVHEYVWMVDGLFSHSLMQGFPIILTRGSLFIINLYCGAP